MTIPELTKDLAIISKLGTVPSEDDGLSEAQLKAKFDEAALAIQEYLNQCAAILNEILGDEASASLLKTGGTMAGNIGMNGNRVTDLGTPAADGDAVPKSYVLPKAGGAMTGNLTMGGNIAMGGNRVTGLGAPEEDADAVSKSYVDGRYSFGSVTLSASGWDDLAQTVSVSGVTADKTKTAVVTAAEADSVDAYLDAGIKCSAQGSGTLTFICTEVPSADIVVNVIVLKKG